MTKETTEENNQNDIIDDIDQLRERVAIEVEHLPDAEAAAEYERRLG